MARVREQLEECNAGRKSKHAGIGAAAAGDGERAGSSRVGSGRKSIVARNKSVKSTGKC